MRGDHSPKEIAMKMQASLTFAATVLLSSVTVASAANMTNPAKASDTLSLTTAQQKTAWKDIYMPSWLNQKAPSGFRVIIGAVVPNSVTTAAVPSKAAGAVPSLKPYDFAMVQKKLAIVNPSDRKIAEVITG
jgi:hypothetical protein